LKGTRRRACERGRQCRCSCCCHPKRKERQRKRACPAFKYSSKSTQQTQGLCCTTHQEGFPLYTFFSKPSVVVDMHVSAQGHFCRERKDKQRTSPPTSLVSHTLPLFKVALISKTFAFSCIPALTKRSSSWKSRVLSFLQLSRSPAG